MVELRHRRAGAAADDSVPAPASSSPAVPREQLQTLVWYTLILGHWVLDFGRPIANLFITTPDHMPGIGDIFHFIYNIMTPFLLLVLLDATPTKLPRSLRYLLIIVFEAGASMHLVGDSVQLKLLRMGFRNDVSVANNAVMQGLDRRMVDIFRLLYDYDEHIGHGLWYVAFFVVLVVYYHGSFLADDGDAAARPSLSFGNVLWLLFGAVFFVYSVVEGQITPMFSVFATALLVVYAVNVNAGKRPDINARFMHHMFIATVVMTVVWWYLLAWEPYTVPEFWDVLFHYGYL